MEYSVAELAEMSGVSTRTLRYYEKIGLLVPSRVSSNGYRKYDSSHADALMQILFYRELGIPLCEISRLMHSPGFDAEKTLEEHLRALTQKKEEIEGMIKSVNKTLCSLKGECDMKDSEKFECFKKQNIEENEAKYGAEIRKRYGEDVVDATNKRFSGMSQEKWNRVESIRNNYENLLKSATEAGDPSTADAQEAAKLHGEWIASMWGTDKYSKEAHVALCQGYTCDERFRAYYDNIAPGAAEFLLRAVEIYCKA